MSGKIDIIQNGDVVASLRRGESVSVEVAGDSVRVQARMEFCTSDVIDVRLSSERISTVEVKFSLLSYRKIRTNPESAITIWEPT